MEYFLFFLCIVVGVIIFFIKGIYGEKTKKKKFVKNLKTNYGKENERIYKEGEYEHISHYSLKYKKNFYIDDITWNDLNMDAVFMQMNYTHSSAGEECLYSMLRNPKLTDDFDRMEELISYFLEEENDRIKLQEVFHDIGRTGKFSICDYLDYLEDLGEPSNKTHILWNCMYIPACLLLYVNIAYGVLALLAVLIHNIVSYFKYKEVINPYITSFAYIFKMLDGVSKIEKQKISAIEREQRILGEKRKKFKKFGRFSFFVMSVQGGSGNPFESINDYFRMCFHVDIIKFNSMLQDVRNHIDDIYQMLQILGELDAYLAIGEYRTHLGEYCIPEFGMSFSLEDGVHPLLRNPVKNSIHANKNILLTGSNASGKSTFLKMVAINSLLAQSIHTCAAKSYQGDLYRLFTSMALRDDIFSGESYYIVEIRALKRILDTITDDSNPVLCFVDEVLRGTNTVERIAASTQILESLSHHKVVCFAATHDIELTYLLEDRYENYHFEEEMIDNDIVFHYQLLEGCATTRNAIGLLKIMGYEEQIINNANAMASEFVKTGAWQTDWR
ncbi:MAG: hypothetical protein R3Y24_00435 [Eubacteriales bacterium]